MLSKRSFRISRSLVFVLIVGASAYGVSSQNTGGVKGKIRNMAGERIAGATVTARRGTDDVRSIRSDSNGEFHLVGLNAGTYDIVIEAKGYSSGIKHDVEIKSDKTVDLGDRLIMQVDRGTQVIVRGSVFFNDGTSVPGAKVLIQEIASNGSARKIGNATTNAFGEFAFSRPERAAKYRMTVTYRDSTASKEIEVDSAAIYRLAISLNIPRPSK